MDHFKQWVDAASIGTAVGTLVGMLPAIAALMSIIWTVLRILETRTVRRCIKDHFSKEQS